ncbi:hypothetical protein YC2023_022603 [Brassica napus]
MESKGRLLPVGAWRHIQNFTLSPSTGMYRATDHPFKMSIIQNTAITRSPLINEDMFLSLVDFQTVLGGSLKTCFLIDVIGQVVDLGDLETIQVSGKPRMKIEFTLRDMNDARVPCCLWGKFAEILYEGCSKDEEGKPICLIRFVDEVKPLAICEGRDEILDLEEVKSIQDKRDKWMLFPKRTIHGLLESTQVGKIYRQSQIVFNESANVESSESDQDLALTSGEENSVNLLDNEEHIECLSTPSTTPSTKRKGAWSDPPRDITSTSKNLRLKTIKVEKMSDLDLEAGKKT